MATSFSSGSSTNESTSTPTFLETPENSLIDQLSGVAAGLAQQMNAWAQQQFAKTSAVTDQTVGNFFQVSQKMMGFAQGLTDQYNNLFAPENAQLVADANSYASPERMAVDMGMAGGTQAMAGDHALRNSERDLLSYGIDPSSGRYAALDKAAEVQNAANIAGAENLQRNQDIATGQRLRSEAVQVGAQLPAAISNAHNTAIQANTGASNASLANANTGANLNRLPNEYLKTAMDIKLPPTGQNSQSRGSSQQSSNSSSPSNQDGSGGRGGGGGGQQPGGGGSGGGGGQPWQSASGRGVNSPGGGGGGTYNRGPGSRIMQMPGQDSGGYGYDQPDASFDYLDQGNDPGSFSGTGYGSVGPQVTDSFDYGGSNPFGDSGFGQTFDYGGPDQTFGNQDYSDFTASGWGNQSNIGYDAGANNASPGWENTYDQPQQWPSSFDSGTTPFNNYDGGASSFGGDYGSGSDPYSSDNYYAAGGQVQSRGAMVPRAASPSSGQRTDDVRANLNAGEFVVPEDVARWKGAEFFHKLIDTSRRARTTSPIGGKPMPQGDQRAAGAPTFATR